MALLSGGVEAEVERRLSASRQPPKTSRARVWQEEGQNAVPAFAKTKLLRPERGQEKLPPKDFLRTENIRQVLHKAE